MVSDLCERSSSPGRFSSGGQRGPRLLPAVLLLYLHLLSAATIVSSKQFVHLLVVTVIRSQLIWVEIDI